MRDMRGVIPMVIAAVIAIALFTLLAGSAVTVRIGYVGLRYNKFTQQLTGVLPPSFYLVNPLVTGIVQYPTTRRTYIMSGTQGEGDRPDQVDTYWANTKSGVEVGLDVVVYFHLNSDPDKIKQFYTIIGARFGGGDPEAPNSYWSQIMDSFVRPVIQNVINMECAKYDVMEVYGLKKNVVAADIEKHLKAKWASEGDFFICESFNIKAVHLHDDYAAAVRQKMISQEMVATKANEVKQAGYEAQRIRIINQAVGNSPAYIQLKWIEMLRDKNIPMYVLPQGTNLFVQPPVNPVK